MNKKPSWRDRAKYLKIRENDRPCAHCGHRRSYHYRGNPSLGFLHKSDCTENGCNCKQYVENKK